MLFIPTAPAAAPLGSQRFMLALAHIPVKNGNS